MTAPAELLALACSAACEAGELLAKRRPAGRPEVVAVKSSPTDVVTELDRMAENLIRQRIWEQRPGDAVLGEEEGEVAGPAAGPGAGQRGSARVRWIVDPLDGTVNYLYGLADWAVSVAAEVDSEVVAGAVAVPRHGVLFSAAAGGGAWRGSCPAAGGRAARLRCNAGVPLSRALVATGFGYEAEVRRGQGRVVGALLPRVRDIRRGGSAAVDLCSVAAGTVDAYYERGVHLWDIAAGALIAREAGAAVTGLRGKGPAEPVIVAAAPALRAELHDVLVELDADGPA
jgi:myo-inositol-1(or 4)-monophosphatase